MMVKLHIPTSPGKIRLKELKGSLISVAGLRKRKIVNQVGQELGVVHDVVCHWDTKEKYPPLTGIIAKVSSRKIWIPIANVKSIKQQIVRLNTATIDVRDFNARPGEVALSREVLDHQLIDVDGARVVRASDLYLATLAGKTRLVGVDVGYMPLLRRLGPKMLLNKAIPDSVIDWATIESFGSQSSKSNLKLSAHRQELRRMRPAALADMLEDLGRSERQELLKVLTPELAADALEEMEPKELESLLRESTTKEGAKYIANMEPDEAAEALRGIDNELRDKLLTQIPVDKAANISRVLKYDEETAGGIMNSAIYTAQTGEKLKDVLKRLEQLDSELARMDSIVLVNKKGEYVYDLPLANLIIVNKDVRIDSLIKPPTATTIKPNTPIKEVAKQIVENRSSSIVVTDKKKKPIGRIFVDDVLDIMLPSERLHFPRMYSS